MGEMMTFPETIQEFLEQHKIVDTEQVYTNGAELVPIFRVLQWYDAHITPAKPQTNADKIRQLTDEELADFITRQRFSVVNTLADKLGIDVTVAFIISRKNVLDWLKREVESDA